MMPSPDAGLPEGYIMSTRKKRPNKAKRLVAQPLFRQRQETPRRQRQLPPRSLPVHQLGGFGPSDGLKTQHPESVIMSAADDTFREWCMYYTFVPVLLLRTLVAASAMSLVVACAAEPLAQSSLVGNAAAPPVSVATMPSSTRQQKPRISASASGASSSVQKPWQRAFPPPPSTAPSPGCSPIRR